MISSTKDYRQKKVAFASLGCPKALVDSENILTELQKQGYITSSNYENADIVVVNTCGFIDSAKRESLDTIAEALDCNGKVIVTGCMGAQSDTITSSYPKVLAVTGPAQTAEVVQLVKLYAPQEKDYNAFEDVIPKQGIKLTPKHYAYIKISEGCNHKCSFCIIPSMRGKLLSRPAAEIYKEAETLLHSGVRELLIVSQDTSAYGSDLKYQASFADGLPIASRLPDLCRAIHQIDNTVWQRLHYVYPYPNVIKLVELMAENIVLPYLDVPLQHASPKILKSMRRPGNRENVINTIKRWRSICADICIRSTFIVGFPGETEADFQQLLDFITETKLHRVGVFQYSDVDGAYSQQLDNKVDAEVKQYRFDKIMQTQQQVSMNNLQQWRNKELDVVIDDIDSSQLHCRSFMDAPEIDGAVLVKPFQNAVVGQRIRVKIVDSSEYDLYGESIA